MDIARFFNLLIIRKFAYNLEKRARG